jgi:hypothetical protein
VAELGYQLNLSDKAKAFMLRGFDNLAQTLKKTFKKYVEDT